MSLRALRTLDVPGGLLQELAGAAYVVIGRVVAGLTFIAVWIGACFAWGPLAGLSFGWFPASIAALLARYLWPAVVIGGLWLRAVA